ncbi:MAG TPA: carboxypeptidase-like regulatory domain-containing protein [Pyrinomonadaceae bacterium]|jgi:hypothetical protein
MKSTKKWSTFSAKAAFFILFTISTTIFVQAQTVTFAQFVQREGTNDFVFTNNATSASFQTIANGSPVFFVYQNVNNLPPVLQGPQLARIYLTSTTTTPAFQAAGDPPRDIQRFSETVTIQIVRDTPAGVGTGSQRNLLTAIITPDGTTQSSLAGDDLSDAIAYTASDVRQTVRYSSDFLGFLPTNIDNLGLSFSSVNPGLSIGAGGFLNSFTAAGAGTFASNNAPVFNPPTAAGVAVQGRVLSNWGRPVARATVTLTGQNGQSLTATTNSLGYFSFSDVESGQIITLSIAAKGYTYNPVVLNLSDNISDLEFFPAP